MTTIALTPRPAARFDAFRLACALLCCVAVAGVLCLAVIQRASGSELSSSPAGTFGGTTFPVRSIEYDNARQSGAPLVSVPCAGSHARHVSSCWISRGKGH